MGRWGWPVFQQKGGQQRQGEQQRRRGHRPGAVFQTEVGRYARGRPGRIRQAHQRRRRRVRAQSRAAQPLPGEESRGEADKAVPGQRRRDHQKDPVAVIARVWIDQQLIQRIHRPRSSPPRKPAPAQTPPAAAQGRWHMAARCRMAQAVVVASDVFCASSRPGQQVTRTDTKERNYGLTQMNSDCLKTTDHTPQTRRGRPIPSPPYAGGEGQGEGPRPGRCSGLRTQYSELLFSHRQLPMTRMGDTPGPFGLLSARLARLRGDLDHVTFSASHFFRTPFNRPLSAPQQFGRRCNSLTRHPLCDGATEVESYRKSHSVSL